MSRAFRETSVQFCAVVSFLRGESSMNWPRYPCSSLAAIAAVVFCVMGNRSYAADPPPRVNGIVGSEVVSADSGWCDGKHLHQQKTLVLSIQVPNAGTNAPPSKMVAKRWDEISKAACSETPPASKQRILAFDQKKKFPLRSASGFCVCGYNTRNECDAGGYLHYVSDCFDEDGTYCGYDDQVSGRC